MIRRAICGPPPPRTLSEDEQRRFLAVLTNSAGFEAHRDHAMFDLMLSTGIRLSSALSLDDRDVDLERDEVTLRSTKGDRPVVVYLGGVEDLIDSDLKEANLSWANLIDSKLLGANLRRAWLLQADLTEANLIRADLREAKFDGTNLSGAELRQAVFQNPEKEKGARQEALVRGADFRKADLAGADWSGFDLTDTQLQAWCVCQFRRSREQQERVREDDSRTL